MDDVLTYGLASVAVGSLPAFTICVIAIVFLIVQRRAAWGVMAAGAALAFGEVWYAAITGYLNVRSAANTAMLSEVARDAYRLGFRHTCVGAAGWCAVIVALVSIGRRGNLAPALPPPVEGKVGSPAAPEQTVAEQEAKWGPKRSQTSEPHET